MSVALSPGISECASARRRKCGHPGAAVSPWKSAYIRQHRIENNWRTGDTREPMVTRSHARFRRGCYRNVGASSLKASVSDSPTQVLKGHDDHVITCLQFSGDLIVSGSDDNTLKVWSAITGKVRDCSDWWAGSRSFILKCCIFRKLVCDILRSSAFICIAQLIVFPGSIILEGTLEVFVCLFVCFGSLEHQSGS